LLDARRWSSRAAFFLAENNAPGVIVEQGLTAEVFDEPVDQRTRDYVQGRFG